MKAVVSNRLDFIQWHRNKFEIRRDINHFRSRNTLLQKGRKNIMDVSSSDRYQSTLAIYCDKQPMETAVYFSKFDNISIKTQSVANNDLSE